MPVFAKQTEAGHKKVTMLAKLLGTAVTLGLLSDTYMYVRSRGELGETNERLEKFFPFRLSQAAWMRAYVSLARSRSLPIWPVYTHWIAWLVSVILLSKYKIRLRFDPKEAR
jgi:hypothetical protein